MLRNKAEIFLYATNWRFLGLEILKNSVFGKKVVTLHGRLRLCKLHNCVYSEKDTLWVKKKRL